MTDELIKNIVNKLLNKFITKGTLPGEHRQMILLEEEVDELEFDLTQSLQKYGEKVREEERKRIRLEIASYSPISDRQTKDLLELVDRQLTSLTKQKKGQR